MESNELIISSKSFSKGHILNIFQWYFSNYGNSVHLGSIFPHLNNLPDEDLVLTSLFGITNDFNQSISSKDKKIRKIKSSHSKERLDNAISSRILGPCTEVSLKVQSTKCVFCLDLSDTSYEVNESGVFIDTILTSCKDILIILFDLISFHETSKNVYTSVISHKPECNETFLLWSGIINPLTNLDSIFYSLNENLRSNIDALRYNCNNDCTFPDLLSYLNAISYHLQLLPTDALSNSFLITRGLMNVNITKSIKFIANEYYKLYFIVLSNDYINNIKSLATISNQFSNKLIMKNDRNNYKKELINLLMNSFDYYKIIDFGGVSSLNSSISKIPKRDKIKHTYQLLGSTFEHILAVRFYEGFRLVSINVDDSVEKNKLNTKSYEITALLSLFTSKLSRIFYEIVINKDVKINRSNESNKAKSLTLNWIGFPTSPEMNRWASGIINITIHSVEILNNSELFKSNDINEITNQIILTDEKFSNVLGLQGLPGYIPNSNNSSLISPISSLSAQIDVVEQIARLDDSSEMLVYLKSSTIDDKSIKAKSRSSSLTSNDNFFRQSTSSNMLPETSSILPSLPLSSSLIIGELITDDLLKILPNVEYMTLSKLKWLILTKNEVTVQPNNEKISTDKIPLSHSYISSRQLSKISAVIESNPLIKQNELSHTLLNRKKSSRNLNLQLNNNSKVNENDYTEQNVLILTLSDNASNYITFEALKITKSCKSMIDLVNKCNDIVISVFKSENFQPKRLSSRDGKLFKLFVIPSNKYYFHCINSLNNLSKHFKILNIDINLYNLLIYELLTYHVMTMKFKCLVNDNKDNYSLYNLVRLLPSNDQSQNMTVELIQSQIILQYNDLDCISNIIIEYYYSIKLVNDVKLKCNNFLYEIEKLIDLYVILSKIFYKTKHDIIPNHQINIILNLNKYLDAFSFQGYELCDNPILNNQLLNSITSELANLSGCCQINSAEGLYFSFNYFNENRPLFHVISITTIDNNINFKVYTMKLPIISDEKLFENDITSTAKLMLKIKYFYTKSFIFNLYSNSLSEFPNMISTNDWLTGIKYCSFTRQCDLNITMLSKCIYILKSRNFDNQMLNQNITNSYIKTISKYVKVINSTDDLFSINYEIPMTERVPMFSHIQIGYVYNNDIKILHIINNDLSNLVDLINEVFEFASDNFNLDHCDIILRIITYSTESYVDEKISPDSVEENLMKSPDKISHKRLLHNQFSGNNLSSVGKVFYYFKDYIRLFVSLSTLSTMLSLSVNEDNSKLISGNDILFHLKEGFKSYSTEIINHDLNYDIVYPLPIKNTAQNDSIKRNLSVPSHYESIVNKFVDWQLVNKMNFIKQGNSYYLNRWKIDECTIAKCWILLSYSYIPYEIPKKLTKSNQYQLQANIPARGSTIIQNRCDISNSTIKLQLLLKTFDDEGINNDINDIKLAELVINSINQCFHEVNQMILLEDMYDLHLATPYLFTLKNGKPLNLSNAAIDKRNDEHLNSSSIPFIENQFSCQMIETIELSIHNGFSLSFDVLIRHLESSVLTHFIINNREQCYVMKDSNNNVFYMHFNVNAENSINKSINLLIYGITVMETSTKEQLSVVLENRLIEVSAKNISSILSRSGVELSNTQTQISYINFLKQSGRSRYVQFKYQLPNTINDIVLYLSIMKQILLSGQILIKPIQSFMISNKELIHPASIGYNLNMIPNQIADHTNKEFKLERKRHVMVNNCMDPNKVNPIFYNLINRNMKLLNRFEVNYNESYVPWQQLDYSFIYNYMFSTPPSSSNHIKILTKQIGQGLALTEITPYINESNPSYLITGSYQMLHDDITNILNCFVDQNNCNIKRNNLINNSIINSYSPIQPECKCYHNKNEISVNVYPTVSMQTQALNDFFEQCMHYSLIVYQIERILSIDNMNEYTDSMNLSNNTIISFSSNEIQIALIHEILNKSLQLPSFILATSGVIPIKFILPKDMSLLLYYECIELITNILSDSDKFIKIKTNSKYNLLSELFSANQSNSNTTKWFNSRTDIKTTTLFGYNFTNLMISNLSNNFQNEFTICEGTLNTIDMKIINEVETTFTKVYIPNWHRNRIGLIDLTIQPNGLYIYYNNISNKYIKDIFDICQNKVIHYCNIYQVNEFTECNKIGLLLNLNDFNKLKKYQLLLYDIINHLYWENKTLSRIKEVDSNAQNTSSCLNKIPNFIWLNGDIIDKVSISLSQINDYNTLNNCMVHIITRLSNNYSYDVIINNNDIIIVISIPYSMSIVTITVSYIQLDNQLVITSRLLDIRLDIIHKWFKIQSNNDLDTIMIYRFIDNCMNYHKKQHFDIDNEKLTFNILQYESIYYCFKKELILNLVNVIISSNILSNNPLQLIACLKNIHNLYQNDFIYNYFTLSSNPLNDLSINNKLLYDLITDSQNQSTKHFKILISDSSIYLISCYNIEQILDIDTLNNISYLCSGLCIIELSNESQIKSVHCFSYLSDDLLNVFYDISITNITISDNDNINSYVLIDELADVSSNYNLLLNRSIISLFNNLIDNIISLYYNLKMTYQWKSLDYQINEYTNFIRNNCNIKTLSNLSPNISNILNVYVNNNDSYEQLFHNIYNSFNSSNKIIKFDSNYDFISLFDIKVDITNNSHSINKKKSKYITNELSNDRSNIINTLINNKFIHPSSGFMYDTDITYKHIIIKESYCMIDLITSSSNFVGLYIITPSIFNSNNDDELIINMNNYDNQVVIDNIYNKLCEAVMSTTLDVISDM